MENNKTAKEFYELVQKYLVDPRIIGITALSQKEVKTMAILTTILQIERSKFRDQLIMIRTLADENLMKSKQKLTNLIKELK